jgi:hypothetical protein
MNRSNRNYLFKKTKKVRKIKKKKKSKRKKGGAAKENYNWRKGNYPPKEDEVEKMLKGKGSGKNSKLWEELDKQTQDKLIQEAKKSAQFDPIKCPDIVNAYPNY